MLVLREKKTNHMSIWIFIINVMKGVSLSTHLKVVFYMKRPPTSCSFQLTQCWCAPTRRTNVYCDWFRDSGTQLHSGHCLIDRLHSVRQGIGCQHVETELVKVLQLKYPTISYTNKLYEGNKKTLLTQTLHRKTLNKIASQNQKICSPAVGHKPRFAREIIAKLLCDDNLNAEIKWKEHIIK